jgi:hypothetical protein
MKRHWRLGVSVIFSAQFDTFGKIPSQVVWLWCPRIEAMIFPCRSNNFRSRHPFCIYTWCLPGVLPIFQTSICFHRRYARFSIENFEREKYYRSLRLPFIVFPSCCNVLRQFHSREAPTPSRNPNVERSANLGPISQPAISKPNLHQI